MTEKRKNCNPGTQLEKEVRKFQAVVKKAMPRQPVLKLTDEEIFNMTENLVRTFLNDQQKWIESIYKYKCRPFDLFYFVVLKRDSLACRDRLFKFYEFYENVEFSGQPHVSCRTTMWNAFSILIPSGSFCWGRGLILIFINKKSPQKVSGFLGAVPETVFYLRDSNRLVDQLRQFFIQLFSAQVLRYDLALRVDQEVLGNRADGVLFGHGIVPESEV